MRNILESPIIHFYYTFIECLIRFRSIIDSLISDIIFKIYTVVIFIRVFLNHLLVVIMLFKKYN